MEKDRLTILKRFDFFTLKKYKIFLVENKEKGYHLKRKLFIDVAIVGVHFPSVFYNENNLC